MPLLLRDHSTSLISLTCGLRCRPSLEEFCEDDRRHVEDCGPGGIGDRVDALGAPHCGSPNGVWMWAVRCQCILPQLLQRRRLLLRLPTGLLRRWLRGQWLRRMPKAKAESVASGGLHHRVPSGGVAAPGPLPGVPSQLSVQAARGRPHGAAARGTCVRLPASGLPSAGGAPVRNQHAQGSRPSRSGVALRVGYSRQLHDCMPSLQ